MKTELMVMVEKIVRPIACSRQRKLRMREELSDLLAQIYDEELSRQPDAATALAVAAQRMGDAGELRGALEQSLSRWDRCVWWGDRYLCPPQLTWRHVLCFGISVALLEGALMLPAMEVVRRFRDVPDLRVFLLFLSVLFGIMAAVNLVVGNWALGGQRRLPWHQASPARAWRRLLAGAVLSGLAQALAMACLYWAADPAAPLVDLWRLGLFGLASGIVFLVVVLLIQQEREAAAPWEELTWT